MKKILLQKGRDEVGATFGSSIQPVVFHREIPFSGSATTPSEDCQRIAVTPSGGCSRITTPIGEQVKIGTPSDERLRVSTPPRDPQPPSRSEILPASSLMSARPVPVSSVPVLMMPPNPRGASGLDKYYLGDTSDTMFGLPSYAFPGFYQIGDGRFQTISPSRVLQYSQMKDEGRADFQVPQQEPFQKSIPLQSLHEDVLVQLHKKAEHQTCDKHYSYVQKSSGGVVSTGSHYDAIRMDRTRREAGLDPLSSSNVTEQISDSMEIVDVDSDEEDSTGRQKSRGAKQYLEDDRNDDLPRMIDKERQRMQMSPSSVSDSHKSTKNEHTRSSSLESFKSPGSTGQKTMYRPKGRPAKLAGGGDGGPGGRSIIRCPVCGKLFNNSSALAKHKLTHSDERKYACTLCSKAFKRQDHLNGHMMTHSSTKPFGCKFIGCNKSYCDARSLRRHMENHHQECANTTTTSVTGSSAGGYFNFDASFPQAYGGEAGGDKTIPYLQQVSPISPDMRDGPQPSRQFPRISSEHPQTMMWVTGYNPLDEPKPVKCHVCGRGFKNIPALNGHMRLHGGYVRKDQDLYESQDVSRGSDHRSESVFSHQSESNQSSASFADRQHDTMPGLTASASLPIDPEIGRRHFLLNLTKTDGESEVEVFEKTRDVSNNEPRNLVFNLFQAGGNPIDHVESRRRNETMVVRQFDATHGTGYGRFRDLGGELSNKCPSPGSVRHEENNAKGVAAVRGKHVDKDRHFAEMSSLPLAGDVRKIPAECSTATAVDCKYKVNYEAARCETAGADGLDMRHQHLKLEKSQDGEVEMAVQLPSEPGAAVNRFQMEEACLSKFQSGTRSSRHLKSHGKRVTSVALSHSKPDKAGETMMQGLEDEYLLYGTSGREDVDVCSLAEQDPGLKEPTSCTRSHILYETCSVDPPLLPSESNKRSTVADALPEKAAASRASCLAALHNTSAASSPPNVQSGCLYRKRWMSLQLKQAGHCCPDLSEARCDSPLMGSCHETRAVYEAGTDCGDPLSPKGGHKLNDNIFDHSVGCKDNSDESKKVSGMNSGCLPGSHEASFSRAHTGPAAPAQHGGQISPPFGKRGSSVMFNYPSTVLLRDVTAAVVHGCHGVLASRDGLHHVHSNSCIPQSDPSQSHIPCSPYELHPHTPCAAHTPYTPCQTYTPHTPYTPVNRPGTPKHASHFEFPPRDCLQESSMCDSPFAVHGGQGLLPGQQVEARLALQAEGSHYHPLLQKQKLLDTEPELRSLHQHCQDEPLRRSIADTTDSEKEGLPRHVSMEVDNRLHLLRQRSLERRLSHRHQGSPVLGGNPCHPGFQTEAGNPEDGMLASLPTGAKRDSPRQLHLECDATDEKLCDKRERKRKPSVGVDSGQDSKRPVLVSSSATAATVRTGGSSLQAKDEDHAKKDNPADGVDERCQQTTSGACTDYNVGKVFRNPPSPLKVKKTKPRPEPLFIPANVNHFGFQSRLRSPRLWDGLTRQTPPYTPPPMLSPARSGSGLFWTLQNGYNLSLAVPPVLPRYDKGKSGNSWKDVAQPMVVDDRNPPETDLQPHVNIGPQYQPDLPHFLGNKPFDRDFADYDDRSALVWSPCMAAGLKENEVAQYMDYACCAVIPGNGINKEYALHLLHLCKGDMKKAGKLLLESEPKLPRSSGLKTYKYQECVKWNTAEIELFHRAIMKMDKDFFQIAKMVSTKTVKDCVQFYYLWKKIRPEESKQLKLLRRKREQFELYSRRSKDISQPQKAGERTNTTRNSKKDLDVESLEMHYGTSSVVKKEEAIEDRHWCSVCKRSFTSARYFSVHMKKHEKNKSVSEQIELSSVKLPYPTLNSVA